ncbi:egg cell-secreted protein 1.1-like protein [Tanacetum coccineum]
MANSCLIIMLTLVLATMATSVHTRPLTNTTTYDASTLAARLKLDYDEEGGSPGPACCMAIVKIEKQCWPNLLGSLGFSSQEDDILRGYCDASEDNGDGPMATPPPKPADTTGRKEIYLLLIEAQEDVSNKIIISDDEMFGIIITAGFDSYGVEDQGRCCSRS